MNSNVTVNPGRGPDEPGSDEPRPDEPRPGTPNLSKEGGARDTGGHDPRGALGDLTIGDRVVEKVVSQAIREVPRAGGVPRRMLGQTLGNVKPDGPARVHAKVDGKLVTLTASVSVEYPQPIREVVGEVRERVVDRTKELLALDVVRLDIDVPHLYSAEKARPVVERVQ